jgi:MFS family permease
VLLAAATVGAALFVVSQVRGTNPLVPLAMLRDPILSGGLATSALVSTVMMATLVVGPFYLSRALGLNAALVGVVMSVGPAVVALAGVPAGRVADRVGARLLAIAGLAAMAAGAVLLAVTPARLGVPGYVAPIVVLTLGYAVFQTANNTAVMAGARPERRGVTSGLLNLSRNLGLITGASVMGTVFAIGAGTARLASAPPDAVATGMHVTFGLATILIAGALAIAAGSRPARSGARRRRQPRSGRARPHVVP